MYGTRYRSLRPESRDIYRRNTKIEMVCTLLFLTVVFGIMIARGEVFSARYTAWIFLSYVALTRIVELLRGETYFQLRARDNKIDKTESKKILKSMKEMGNGKK